MIEKFIRIANIGRFRDYKAAGDVSLQKLNLIFAENGRGKTTLCAILRSLQTGKPEFISERSTLGAKDQPSVELRVAGKNFTYNNGAWSNTHSEIAIFDSVFVHENVFAGDHVDHEHRKGLYRVIVGAQGVALAQQVDDLDTKIKDANSDIRTKKAEAEKFVPDSMSLDAFLKLNPIADVEAKIEQKSKDVASFQRAADQAEVIRTRSSLSEISLPTLSSDFAAVLARQIDDVAAEAEQLVKTHISEHMDEHGEKWLSQGLGYAGALTCPFCGQYLDGNKLLAAYQAYFSAEYNALKNDIAALDASITDAIGDAALFPIQKTLADNATLSEFWRQFIPVDLPSLAFESIQDAYSALRKECLVLAEKKNQNPLESVTPGAAFSDATSALKELRAAVTSYNTAVNSYNAQIAAKKQSAGSSELGKAKSELTALDAARRRHKPEVNTTCKAYQDAVSAKQQLDAKKATAKRKLDQYCEKVLRTYQDSINEYLDKFNAGFRISNTRHSYVGGKPSSQFQVVINDISLDLGGEKTPAGTPCFKTALSAGDRSALALAFFLASLKHDASLQYKIVIFDDPFTSLDRFRRTCTGQLVRNLASQAEQVVVLSHDPHFLKLISDGSSGSASKCLQMAKTGTTTVINEWDIETETQSTFMKSYAILLDFYSERKGVKLGVARAIRPFLEGLYRVHFPGHFPKDEWLGDFVKKVRASQSGTGLTHALADCEELEAINEYSKKYHHDQNSNADSEPISEDELHGFVKRTLKLVGGT